MAKKKGAAKNRKQKSLLMEIPALVTDVKDLPPMPADIEPLLSPLSDGVSEVEDLGFTTTCNTSNAIIDGTSVPSSPPAISQQHDGSGDSANQNHFLDKELFAPQRYIDGPTVVEAPFKGAIDIGKERRVEKSEKKTVSPRKNTAPIPGTKHPLQEVWVFWYYQGDKKKSWQENLLRLLEFDTVEDFWSMYNHTVQPSNLPPGRDFNLFKRGIRPEWEDPHNTGGGMWSVTLRERRMRSPEMDAVWIEVAMLLIGDQFDHLASFVNGATYSARKNQDRVSLWIKADLDRNRDEIQAIGERLRKAVQFAGSNFVLEYATSDDWKYKAGPTVNARIILQMQ